jgi:hypothetical protein
MRVPREIKQEALVAFKTAFLKGKENTIPSFYFQVDVVGPLWCPRAFTMREGA